MNAVHLPLAEHLRSLTKIAYPAITRNRRIPSFLKSLQTISRVPTLSAVRNAHSSAALQQTGRGLGPHQVDDLLLEGGGLSREGVLGLSQLLLSSGELLLLLLGEVCYPLLLLRQLALQLLHPPGYVEGAGGHKR